GAPIAVLAEKLWLHAAGHGRRRRCRRRRVGRLGRDRGGRRRGRLGGRLWVGLGWRSGGGGCRRRRALLLSTRRNGECRRNQQRKRNPPSSIDAHLASRECPECPHCIDSKPLKFNPIRPQVERDRQPEKALPRAVCLVIMAA